MDEIQDIFNFDQDQKVEQTGNVSDQFIENPIYFPPENDEGNVEYKKKISNPSKNRFEHLLTQMSWRIKEGEQIVIYGEFLKLNY